MSFGERFALAARERPPRPGDPARELHVRVEEDGSLSPFTTPMRGAGSAADRRFGDRLLRVSLPRGWHESAALRGVLRGGIRVAGREFRCLAPRDGGTAVFFCGDPREALRWVTDPAAVDSVGRLAARLQLAFSTSTVALRLRRAQVEERPDVRAEGSGAVMTDGCGLISAGLAARIPGAAGRSAAVLQVRLMCWLGTFKGTLLVTSALEGEDRVVVRPSMRKLPPSQRFLSDEDEGQEAQLDLVGFAQAPAAGGACLPSAVTLMLPRLGVSADALVARGRAALRERPQPGALLAAGGRDRELAARMLLAGFSPDEEPFLGRLLRAAGDERAARVRSGRVPVRDSCYLFGVPDPSGTLPAGHVAVLLPPPGLGPGVERVLVTRAPQAHPGDVQRFRVAPPPPGVCGSFAVVFSVLGERAPADVLAGGDYDGDTYFVCWDRALVDAFVPHAPRPPRPTKQAAQGQASSHELELAPRMAVPEAAADMEAAMLRQFRLLAANAVVVGETS